MPSAQRMQGLKLQPLSQPARRVQWEFKLHSQSQLATSNTCIFVNM